MEFQIEKIVLWPKKINMSYKCIELYKNSVNVITGDSKTGKSAIIPIIDYCLASEECYIPINTIRDTCSWFGVVIKLDKGRVLLARKEPGTQKTTSNMMIIQDDDITIPDYPEKNISCEEVKKYLDEYARLSFVEIEDSIYGTRPAFRDMMAFCFQPQNVVANANILFYKTDKMEHRNKLVTMFPYILGAITPEVLSASQELINLKKILKKKKKEYEKLYELTDKWKEEINGWISVAIELGLLDEKVRDFDLKVQVEYLKELTNLKDENKYINISELYKNSEEIVELKKRENDIAMKLSINKNRLVEMNRLMNSIDCYGESLSIQIERLNITRWIYEKSKKERRCPMCQQICEDDEVRENYLGILEKNIKEKNDIEEIPATLEREFSDVKNKIRLLGDELISIQKRIKIEENKMERNDSIGNNRYTLDGILRVLGKIEYASEAVDYLNTDGELLEEIQNIEEKISRLKEIVDETTIKNKIKRAILEISFKQMELLKLLDAERPDDPFRLDYKNLTVEIDGSNGRKNYLWEIGSGSNWLAYHIATILGLQEFFVSFDSSVPNFVVFDQPSQVYFPHQNDEKTLEIELKDLDIKAVKSIFASMIKCLETVKNKMQIIVLEHADNSIYGDIEGVKEVCVWRDGEKLIPDEWIK